MTSLQRVIKYCAIGFAIFLAVTIIYGIASAGTAIISTITGAPFSKNRDKEQLMQDIDSSINSLEIKVSSCKLNIITDDKFRVEAKNVSKDFKVEVSKDGVLQIEDGRSSRYSWINFGNNNAKVDLYLPKDFIAKNVEIENGASEIEIDTLHTENLRISTGAGRLKGNDIIADESARIECGAGEVVLRSVSLQDTVFDCGVGRVSVTGQILGENTIDCGIGEVVLDLKGNIDDYNIDVDKGIGSVRINGDKLSDGSYHNKNASNSIDIDGGVGSIVINIKE